MKGGGGSKISKNDDVFYERSLSSAKILGAPVALILECNCLAKRLQKQPVKGVCGNEFQSL